MDSILLTEPRIEAIGRELVELLRIVQLEQRGVPIEVDAFRLRDIAQWADYPTSLSEMFWHLSSACNLKCEFCYEKGNPPDFPIRNTPRMMTRGEVTARLRHYDPVRRRGVFALRTAINEPFANRNAVEYLRLMRKIDPQELISFVTNGAYLDHDTVRALAELQPLFFNLSIYSVDPGVRRDVLHDTRGTIAIEGPRLLREYRLPYMTNVVMWPSIDLGDLERTVAYMADNGAALMRVCLGGYSRYLPGDVPRFDPKEFWPRVAAEVERLRPRYTIPIVIEPGVYERRDTDAVIDGIIDGSPAQLAGMRRGDRVLALNGRAVETRTQLAARLRQQRALVRLRIARGERELNVILDRVDARCMDNYPYGALAGFDDFAFGIVVTDTLRYSSLASARDILANESFRRALLFTSELMLPVVEFMLEQSHAFDGFDIALRVVPNRYFGGSINAGDLLVVDDFVAAIDDYRVEANGEPEVVLIPSSPFASSPWGRDLRGQPWTDIERRSRVPVRLIPVRAIVF